MPRAPQNHPGVIISSTFKDLEPLRTALRGELVKARLLPIDMEHSVLKPGTDIIGNSLDMVEDAAAYVGVIGLRYGQALKDPRNPNGWSVTRLEYERARELGRPNLMFVMADAYPITKGARRPRPAEKKMLADFRQRVSEDGRLYQPFASPDDFRAHIGQIVARLADHIAESVSREPTEEWRHLPATAKPGALAALTLHAPDPLNALGNYRIFVSADFAPVEASDSRGRRVVVGLRRARLTADLDGFQFAKDSLIGKRAPKAHIDTGVHSIAITGPTQGAPPLLKGDPFADDYFAIIEPGPRGSGTVSLALTANPVADIHVAYAASPTDPLKGDVAGRERQAILAAILRPDLPPIRSGTDIVLDAKSVRRRIVSR